ncbi:MAG: ankyrin repeat domain-containing protein [Bradyrhizobiaceae bacterium]|nr:ankyrin repeat domain-containing protein [Bradyrhizobiaceae bacterium]
MSIRVMFLAGPILGLLATPLFAAAAPAADAVKVSLNAAVRSGDHDAVRTLLNDRGKDELSGREAAAAFIAAAERNDLEAADMLLAAGIDPNAANDYGATALYAAAANADPAMTVKLLAAGADANTHLLSGETPLMAAALRGHVATVTALLDGGADPNLQEHNAGQTALMWALSQRHSAVVDVLVSHKADVNLASKSGSTPLMFAAQGSIQSARTLLAAGARPNDVHPDTGQTALIVASTMGNTDIVALLLDNGADPNIKDANTFTALHAAVRDSDYGTDHASRVTAAATVKVLLAHGANPNARIDQKKQTVRAVNEVSFQGATPLALAAEVNSLDAIKELVKGGADPKIATEQGTTPLMLAVGAGTDVQRTRSQEERALALDTAKYLVDLGVDVNAVGQFGWTALHCATYQGLNDVVEFLVSKGAKIDAFDALGQTPLSISLSVLTKDAGAKRLQIPRRYRRETAELLLRLGATPLNKSGVQIVLQRNGDLNTGIGE